MYFPTGRKDLELSKDSGSEKPEKKTDTSSNDFEDVPADGIRSGIAKEGILPRLMLPFKGRASLISTSGNDTYISDEEKGKALMEDAKPITPAGEYDENGLAPTFHYIGLNYTLV